jgi:GTP-binding protein HflX
VQVELAQLEYLLPRLSGKGINLSRLGGGLGTRGPGEQKLEVDRRRIRERISRLKKELSDITGHRHVRRTQREEFSMLMIALVGYTNSGKSTLFNALTAAGVIAKDQLFSTLDPTVRKLVLPDNQTVLLSDTVGFMHDLPHNLIESFKATLEEVMTADVLFHVVDMSASRVDEETRSVYDVLKELGVEEKPVFTILNKVDKMSELGEIRHIRESYDNAVVVSALEKKNLEAVSKLIMKYLDKDMEEISIKLSHKEMSYLHLIKEKGKIFEEKYLPDGVLVKARVSSKLKNAIFKQIR